MSTEKIIKNLVYASDAYKFTHFKQYPKDVEVVFSNIVMRQPQKGSIFEKENKFVVGPIKYAIDKLNEKFQAFFKLDREKVVDALTKIDKELDDFIGKKHLTKNHWLEVYDYQKLPIDIYYLDAKEEISPNTPIVVMYNNNSKFYWLVNFLETSLLADIWRISTSTNMSRMLYQLTNSYALKTGSEFNPYQVHDFSYRGLGSTESATLSGVGHLSYFSGTDTVPAMNAYKKYIDSEKKIGSIPATEHSIMILQGKTFEFDTFKHILDIYQKGNISIVSDSYDYFNFLKVILPCFKEKILARDGKVVIRPDSGEAISIILKSLKILEGIFGVTINKKGFKILSPKVGLIFGDGLSYHKIAKILKAMKKQNWASENIVFGVGGNTYQTLTRDSLGFVFKTSYIRINNIGKNVYKSPKTSSIKRSLKGIVYVDQERKVVQEGNFKDFYDPKKNIMIKYS